MDGIGTAEGMPIGQLAGIALDGSGELYWLGCRPERLPVVLGGPEGTSIDSVIAGRRRESGSNLWVREAARHSSVAPVPQGGSHVTAFFVDDEFHERARVEVDERHARSVALLDDQFRHRARRRDPTMADGLGTWFPASSTNDALGDESFEQGSCVYAEEASDRYSAIGHEDLFSGPGAVDPLAEVGPEGAHGDIHARQCTSARRLDCTYHLGKRIDHRLRYGSVGFAQFLRRPHRLGWLEGHHVDDVSDAREVGGIPGQQHGPEFCRDRGEHQIDAAGPRIPSRLPDRRSDRSV